MRRRDFLKLSLLPLIPKISFAKEFEDYKAIVVVNLAGGNDSFNTFIPIADDESFSYDLYSKARDNIKVANVELSLDENGEDLTLQKGENNPYYQDNKLSKSYLKGYYPHKDLKIGTNAVMPEIAHLINTGKVAILNNIGNLIMPATKEELTSGKKPTPPFLFAHDFQTKLMMNGESGVVDFTGWAGRLYDMFPQITGSDVYSMNISLAGNVHIFDGRNTKPMILPSNGILKYKNGIDREMFDEFLAVSSDEVGNYYKNLRKHTLILQDVLSEDLSNSYEFTSTNPYGLTIFSKPDAYTLGEKYLTTKLNFLEPLKTIAKLIKIGIDKDLKRQIFYISMGGFDTHSDQTTTHSSLLRGVSYTLGDFYLALKELGIEDKVTIMVTSEFGRSLGENGDGSDHAWGATLFAIGGAIKGGVYGDYVDMRLGGDDDYTQKGRFIPKLSFTQYYATVLKWFGLDENELDLLLPELKNFSKKDLGFL